MGTQEVGRRAEMRRKRRTEMGRRTEMRRMETEEQR
jgi:hypothetical protein